MGDRLPVALTIAGSDSSGGAGIQADLKTLWSLGVYGATAITAITAQNTTGVQAVAPVDAAVVVAQIDSVLSDLAVAAIKTGMLADDAIVAAVADRLARVPDIPLVADPVMVASRGGALLSDTAVDVFRRRLLPRATLLTPNLPEAARLLGEAEARDVAAQVRQARALAKMGARAVLVKGGHGAGDALVDVLFADSAITEFRHPRIVTANTHGTGCTLSAAVVAHLVRGTALRDAVGAAIAFVEAALVAGAARKIGAGTGPLHQQPSGAE